MKRLVLTLAACTAAALLAASCSQEPIAPQVPVEPDFIQIGGGSSPVQPLGKDGKGNKQTQEEAETLLIQASEGGVVSCGRYTVTIPAGALEEDTEITVRVLEVKKTVSCELLPHGLQFQVPVQLSMDLRHTTAEPTDAATIYWWNDGLGRWEDVGGSLDPSVMVVTADLEHFSTYVAGRAGW